MDTTTGGLPYDVPKPSTEDEASSQRGTQVLSDCGLSELPSSIHSEVGDDRLYATFYLQTVMEEVETPIETEKSTKQNLLLHACGEEGRHQDPEKQVLQKTKQETLAYEKGKLGVHEGRVRDQNNHIVV